MIQVSPEKGPAHEAPGVWGGAGLAARPLFAPAGHRRPAESNAMHGFDVAFASFWREHDGREARHAPQPGESRASVVVFQDDLARDDVREALRRDASDDQPSIWWRSSTGTPSSSQITITGSW